MRFIFLPVPTTSPDVLSHSSVSLAHHPRTVLSPASSTKLIPAPIEVRLPFSLSSSPPDSLMAVWKKISPKVIEAVEAYAKFRSRGLAMEFVEGHGSELEKRVSAKVLFMTRDRELDAEDW